MLTLFSSPLFMQPRDIGLAVLTMAIWGFNFVVIKVGLESFPPLLFCALRFLLAALPLVFFVGKPAVPWKYIVGIGLALGVAKFGLLFIGMSGQPIWGGMPAGLASLVLQTQAFFTLLFAAIALSEKPRRNQILGMIVAFSGIGLLAIDKGQIQSLPSLGMVIAAAACWGVANIVMKKANSPDVFRLIIWVSLIPPLPLLGLSWIFEGGDRIVDALTHLNGKGLGALFYISFLSTVLGFGIWGALLKRYKTNLVAPFTLLVPIFGVMSAAIVLQEQLTWVQGLAAGLVLCGLVLNLWRGKGVQ
jgi:O-acetylserine/cysteine efflux transporter